MYKQKKSDDTKCKIIDVFYVSPVGTIKETHAEIVLQIPIKDRVAVKKFIEKIKRISI